MPANLPHRFHDAEDLPPASLGLHWIGDSEKKTIGLSGGWSFFEIIDDFHFYTTCFVL
jgi:hypothetical protein